MTMQSETEEKKILEKIVAISEEFLQSASYELNYQKITDNILDISGAKYAGFNLFDEDGLRFSTMAFSAPEGIVKKASSLLGFKLPGKKWDYDPVRAEKIKFSTINRFSSLSELTGDTIPVPVISLIEKTFNTGEVVLVKILKENVMVGDFTLIMSKGVRFKNDDYVKIYTRQVGLLIARARSDEALKKSEVRYRQLFDNMTTGFALHEMIYDKKGNPVDYRFIEVNSAFEELTGLKASTLIGETVKDIIPGIEQYWIDAYAKVAQTGESISFQNYTESLDKWYQSWVFSPAKNQFATIFSDITDRKKAEEALQESQEKFRDLAQMLPEAVYEMNTQGVLTFVNQQAFEVFGYSRQDFDRGINGLEMLVPQDRERAKKAMLLLLAGKNPGTSEYTAQRIGGSTFPILISSSAIIRQGKAVGIRGLIVDITERKKAEEEIIRLSFHDHLTGLYNRRFFEEELRRLDTERQLPLSFIMGDLNGLKIINDVFGHDEGDRLLKETGEILKTVCRTEDILARWGGDEFVILLPKTSISDAEEIAERIRKECKNSVGQKIALSLSLGAAAKETVKQDINTILVDAESNMYKNKLVEKQSLTSSVIFALEQALYEKSNETKEHTDRMHGLARKLGKSIKLPSSQIDELSLLASLHDIGKVAIPETILLKKEKLTEKEWSIIKRHPEIGFNIAQSSPQIAHIAKSILSCHENFDGSGYPMGLKGQEIPIISRIILIIDAYDVMTSGRTYKPARSSQDAIAELKRCAGTQFDPALVDKFIEILEK